MVHQTACLQPFYCQRACLLNCIVGVVLLLWRWHVKYMHLYYPGELLGCMLFMFTSTTGWK